MSDDAVGIFGKARRLFSCLAGANEHTAGAEAQSNGALFKAPGQQPATAVQPRSNSSTGTSSGGVPNAVLRHNPIDVCLTSGEVAALAGNPSQRTFEASWCGVPVHLHVLTFVKRPNPIAQLPPSCPQATVAAALDAPPPVQANMLTQPDMIAIATEVEAALVQLIAEPSPQVMPVLACAKVTCRAHIGSPGDEHVTQRIVAEVHIVTPRVPGTVSLSQWLQQRWPQCDLGNGTPPAAAAAGGDAAAAAPPLPPPPAPSHRLAAASSPTSGVPGAATPVAAAAAGAAAIAVVPGRVQVLSSGPSASRLGISQPIAEGVTSRDVGMFAEKGSAGQDGRRASSALGPGAGARAPPAAARVSATAAEGIYGSAGGVTACMPCFALFFAPPPPLLTAASGGVAAGTGGMPAQPPQSAAGPVRAAQGAAAPGDAGSGTGNGGRRLIGPGTSGLVLARGQRFPLPPPPPRLPRLPVPEALEVLICLAEALRNLHRRGLTHGSLTPKTIQLQLVEVESATGAAVGAAAVASVAVAAPAGSPPPAGQGASQSSCPTAQSAAVSSPQSQPQPRCPANEPGQMQQAEAGPQRAGSPASGGVPTAACGPVASTALPLGAGGDTGPVTSTAAAVATASPPGSPSAARMAAGAAESAVAAAVAGTGAEGAPAGETTGAEASPGGPGPAAEATDDTAPAAAPTVDAAREDAAAATEEGGPGAAGGGSPTRSAEAPAAFASPTTPFAGVDKRETAGGGGGGGGEAGGGGASKSPLSPPPAASVALSPQQRQKPTPSARRRAPPSAALGGTIRTLLPLPAVGPALLQMQTWGRARPVGLPRDHMLWCAPELLSAGGVVWGPPPLARRSGNGSASAGGSMGMMSLGPLDQSIGCRGGNHRLRVGNHHNHHNRHFGDGSYGGSMGGGNSRRYRFATSLLMGQDPGAAGASANGITPSCDVYSLGMLMWYLVSGQPPLQHLTSHDQVLRVKEMGSLDEQLPFSAELPSGYVQLARRCWAPLPMQRPTMNVVLSEMRSLRAQLLGLPGQRELGGGPGAAAAAEHGFGYGGSSMGEMTNDSRLSFTLSLPLSSRDLSNGEDYSLVRPPLELAFGVNDASGGGGSGSAAGDAVGAGGMAAGGGSNAGAGGLAATSAPPPPPPPLKGSLAAALLTALTAPRRGSVGGGGGLMDDDDNYSDTDRFTEAHTEASGGGTPYSSPPTAGTTAGGRAGGASVGGASARLRAAAAAAAAAASTARSFRMMRLGHRAGSTAGSAGRSGGSAAAAALLAATGSRRGVSPSHVRNQWGSMGDVGSGPVVGAQQQQQPHVSGGSGRLGGGGGGVAACLATHPSMGRMPSALAAAAAAAGNMKSRCASSSALVSMATANSPQRPGSASASVSASASTASAVGALRSSNTPGSGGMSGAAAACCGGGGCTTGSSDGSGNGGAGAAAAGSPAAGGGGGGPASISGRESVMVSATSQSIGCLAVPCGNGSGGGTD